MERVFPTVSSVEISTAHVILGDPKHTLLSDLASLKKVFAGYVLNPQKFSWEGPGRS